MKKADCREKVVTKEPQYQHHQDLKEREGLKKLGLRANAQWDNDPRMLLIGLARYKFAAKMLKGKKRVLEIGCGDAFGTRLVQQEVESLHAIDFDPVFVDDVNDRMDEKWKFECIVHDILNSPVSGSYDAAFSLDVIEHIEKKDERTFLRNIVASLEEPGVLIIGTPSIESQAYAAPLSKIGHINCKDEVGLRSLLKDFFHEVFIFSMNDEVVHTGFYHMAHYLFAICVGKKAIEES
ncbi:MAG: Methyltransferase domain protein [Syntrophorhabdus sp. PtaB.Bin184]|jgi:2-polyprenyl-3-methyl-5-hydroxy-6-metoxy-1,4-benzoquinol methylase|nr:MAG: Methyltransferase domain protein [Syntrophorhabdus sp. PtaB.Bin184]